MQSLSVATQIPDTYRAGVYLGEKLQAINPEVVFLFTSIDYGNTADILEGLNDGLDNDRCIIIGNSGDGFYETHGVGETGAAVLGLNSNGKIQWQLHIGEDVTANPMAATRQALRNHEQASLVFMVSDFHADASLIEQVLEHEIHVPVIGGFAADDQQWRNCALYANKEVLGDCVVALHAVGELNFSIYIENSITPIGNVGQIQIADGNRIDKIDGLPAMRFMERETGKPILRSDRGIISLTIIDPQPNLKRLRSTKSDIGDDDESLTLYGGINAGQQVQVCIAEPELLIEEVYRIAEAAKQQGTIDPVAAIIVSCAGRKNLLGSRIEHEVSALTRSFGDLAMIGFPSLGEIGPLRTPSGYSANLFHNMTYVLLLIGT